MAYDYGNSLLKTQTVVSGSSLVQLGLLRGFWLSCLKVLSKLSKFQVGIVLGMFIILNILILVTFSP